MTHATPLLLGIVFSVFLFLVKAIIPEEILAKAGFSLASKEINVDEDLPNFFEAIKFSHANEMIHEYHNIRDCYGFEIYENELIEKLENICYPSKTIQGTPWYNILSNHDYAEGFNYINAMLKDRVNYIKDIHDDRNV